VLAGPFWLVLSSDDEVIPDQNRPRTEAQANGQALFGWTVMKRLKETIPSGNLSIQITLTGNNMTIEDKICREMEWGMDLLEFARNAETSL
jgi:hypothetical protein